MYYHWSDFPLFFVCLFVYGKAGYEGRTGLCQRNASFSVPNNPGKVVLGGKVHGSKRISRSNPGEKSIGISEFGLALTFLFDEALGNSIFLQKYYVGLALMMLLIVKKSVS